MGSCYIQVSILQADGISSMHGAMGAWGKCLWESTHRPWTGNNEELSAPMRSTAKNEAESGAILVFTSSFSIFSACAVKWFPTLHVPCDGFSSILPYHDQPLFYKICYANFHLDLNFC